MDLVIQMAMWIYFFLLWGKFNGITGITHHKLLFFKGYDGLCLVFTDTKYGAAKET